MFKRLSLLAICVSVLIVAAPAMAVDIDPKFPAYQKVSGVSGELKFVGSDTLNNLVGYLCEAFTKFYPSVKTSLEGKGSGTAPPALIEGTAQIGDMSREMKPSEIEKFEKKFGYKPARISVAIDALAVFVHKDNPIKGLTLAQLDGIFSKTFKSGSKDIKTWGDLGLTGEWADKPIVLYGRNSASGTYAYFKEEALAHGDYKDTVKEQSGSSGVINAVASDKYAIGYSGVGYKTADVKVVLIGKQAGKYFDPMNPAHAYSGDYPLARDLYQYFNKSPKQALTPLMAEFIKFVNSKEGQSCVLKAHFYPISWAQAEENLKAGGMTK